MPKIAGIGVNVEFTAFPNKYPDLYYAAGAGAYNLASANAGNSDGLCVGLLGVNGQFYTDLTAAGQKKAGTNPQGDDYEARHQALRLKALADPSHSASETYAVTDPSVFSYCYAAQVTQASGYFDGVCFVDVFDAALRPAGNAKNVAMLYVAPPYDVNYSSQAAFLLAIESTAHNIVATVAGYNALAAGQKLPVVEALRLTLYSSGFYNNKLKADHGDIARAIWRGLLAGIQAFPASGLLELQLPAGTGTQDVLFGVLQGDAAFTAASPAPGLAVAVPTQPVHHAPVVSHLGPGKIAQLEVFSGERTFHEEAGVFDEFSSPPDVQTKAADDNVLQATDVETRAVIQGIEVEGQRWLNHLQGNQQGGVAMGNVGAAPAPAAAAAPAANGNGIYAGFPQPGAAAHYIPVGGPWAGPRRIALDAAIDMWNAMANMPQGKSRDVRQRVNDFKVAQDTINEELKTQRGRADDLTLTPAQRAQALADVAYLEPFRRRVGDQVKAYMDVARIEYTSRRSAETKPARIAAGIVGVLSLLGAAAGIWRGIADNMGAKDLTLPFGPKRKGVAWPKLVFDVVAENAYAGLVSSIVLSAATPSANWKLEADNTVTYTPGDTAADGTVTYSVTLSNTNTYTAKLTAGFAPDLVTAPTDRTTAVSLSAREGFKFVVDPATPSAWSIDTTGKQPIVKFTPPIGGFTGPYALEAFQDTDGLTIQRNVVILFPAQALPATPVTQPNRAAVSLDAIAPFVATDEVSVVLLSGSPQVESQKVTVTGGVWEVNQGKITFTPDGQLAGGATTLTVDYALKYGTTVSQKATATVSYPAKGTETAMNLSATALSRTKRVTIAVKGVTSVTPPAGSPGTWTFDSDGIAFTPAGLGTAGTVTVTAQYSVGSSQASVAVTFPQPAVRSLAGVSRVGPAVLLEAATTEPDQRIWLLDSTGVRVDKITTSNQHEWSILPDEKTIQFKPAPSKFVEDSASVPFVFSDGTDNSPLTDATVTFTQATEAFPLTGVSVPLGKAVNRDVTNYCYVAQGKTITGISVFDIDPVFFELTTSSPTVITFQAGQTVATQTGKYRVTDSAGANSNQARLEFELTSTTGMMSRRAMPTLASCFIEQSAVAGQKRIAKVLDGASAFHGVDAASVKLVGPVDLGMGDMPVTVGLATDGKAMYVPFQGVWSVDKGGAILFQADAKFNGAPTPAAFTIADKKGNVSPAAMVMFDDSLKNLKSLGDQVTAMTEQQYWVDFRIHVSLVKPALAAEMFLKVTNARAYAARLAARPTFDPVDYGDFDTAYQAWLDGGQAWDDAPGSKTQIGLVTICQQMVTKAMPAGSPEILTRFWRLQHMAHMVALALPDGGAN